MELNDLKKYFKKIIPESDFTKLYNLGVDAFSHKKYEEALNYFLMAIEQPKIKPQVYYNLALTYQKTGDFDKAAATYQKSFELNPNDYDGLYNLGLVYYEKRNYTKAIEFFEKSLALKEENENIKVLTLAYLNNNQEEKVNELAERFLNENKIDFYFDIARIFEDKNSFGKNFEFIDKAIAMYSKIIEISPDYFEAYLSKAICYAKKGEWDNSVEYCQKALEKNPESYEANNQMGLIFYCCEKTKDAVEYFEKALALNPNDYKIYSNIAYAYEKIMKTDKAIKIFTKMLTKFEEFPSRDEIKNHLRILKEL